LPDSQSVTTMRWAALVLLFPAALAAQSMCAPSTSDVIFANAFELELRHAHHTHDPELDANPGERAREPLAALSGLRRWSDPSTWGGTLPGPTSDVLVPTDSELLLDVDAQVRSVSVCGLLRADRRDLALTAQWIMVMQRGEFRIGSDSVPFAQRFTLTLGPADPTASVMGMGTQLLGAMAGGKLRIYGETRVSWTQLDADVAAGARTITLKAPVDWRAGETIVIASSTLGPNQAETRQIESVSADRLTVTLTNALQYRHFGRLQSFDGRTLDARAEVALRSRNIVIQGPADAATSRFGGHVMIMGSGTGARETNPSLRSSARIRGVEFRRMGQFNRLGRYPIHWHLNDLSAGDFLRHSSFHSNPQRAIVVHGSDEVLIADNAVLGSIGHGYVVEDGSERRNRFERNLGLGTEPASFTAPGLMDQNDQHAATFWLRTAAVTLLDNAAAGGQHAGIWFDMGFVANNNATKALLQFDRNTIHSYRANGDTWALWHTDGFVPSDEGVLQFRGLTAYKNVKAIETAGRGVTRDSILADNATAISQHWIEDSTIVSRSANVDTDTSWGASALFAYGGFANAQRVGFVGFRDNRVIARTLACGIEYPRFAIREARMIDSEPASGCGDVVLSDLDGSVSGSSGARRLVSVEGRPQWPSAGRNGFGLLTSACTAYTPGRPDGYAVCPNYDYRALEVSYPTGAGFANPDWRVEVVRSADGLRQTPEHFRWAAYAIPGFAYAIEVRNQRTPSDPTVYPLDVLSDVEFGLSEGDFARATLPVGGSAFSFDPDAATRSVTLEMALPASGFRLRGCFRDTACAQNAASWPVIAPAASLAALAASGRSGYFRDANRLYVRLLGAERLRYER
jgi:hypothetical protein